MNLRKYHSAVCTVVFFALVWPAAAQVQTYSLEECRKLALEQNKKIKAAQYEVSASQALQRSVAANAYPGIDASVMGVYIGEPLAGAFNGMIPTYVANGSVNVSQAIYAGGKIRYGKEAAGKGVEIRESQKAMTTAEVLLNVERTYWQVVQVNEKIVLATRFEQMLQSLHSDLKNSFDAGLIYKNDLLRVEVSLNEARLNIAKAQDGLVLAKLSLAQAIGAPGNSTFALRDSVSGDFKALERGPLASAPENRPEIQTLKKALEADELQRKILQADKLPVLGLGVSGLAVAGKGVNVDNGKNFMASYYGIASLTFPIFDWGKRTEKVKEQAFKISARQQQAEETQELITLEIQNAYLQLNQSARQIQTSALSLQQADENLKLTNDRFKAGTVVGKDVLEAQAIWQQAYSSLIDAKVTYKMNEAGYKKAIGELK